MHTGENTIPESGKDFDYYRTLLWRKKRAIFTWGASGALLAFVIYCFMPTYYESSATIIIEDPEIPPKLIGSTVTSFAEKRLEVIDQRIMTASNLGRIIREFDLYPDIRRNEPILTAVRRMREDFDLEKVSARLINPDSGRLMSALISFTLTYRSHSPQVAQKVTRELARLYLAYNYNERRKQATEVAEFLSDEAARLAERVDTLESSLTEFKQKHSSFVAGQGQVITDLIDRTEAQIRAIDGSISALEDRKLVLQRELEIAESQSGDDARSMMTLPQMRAELARISQIYGPEHPDIVLLKRRIAAAAKGDHAAAIAGGDLPLNPAATRVRAQLATIESETKRLQEQKKELQGKFKEYEAKAMASPELEQKYLELRRDYENARAQYDETKRKQLVADQARVLEKSKKAERFTLLEPPQLPREPAGPGVELIVAGGFGVFFLFGLTSVLLRDMIDDRIHSSRQLQAVIGAEPLMLVPVLRTDADRSRQRKMLSESKVGERWRFIGYTRKPRPAA